LSFVGEESSVILLLEMDDLQSRDACSLSFRLCC
jgi:hypothetical protein